MVLRIKERTSEWEVFCQPRSMRVDMSWKRLSQDRKWHERRHGYMAAPGGQSEAQDFVEGGQELRLAPGGGQNLVGICGPEKGTMRVSWGEWLH